jgi:diguanylate cyclase (GGDEF)-like protein/PAS domain S-box-containing protein
LLFGAVCALLVAGLQATGWIGILQRGTMDMMFWVRNALTERSPNSNIVIVVADDQTVHGQADQTAQGQQGYGWPLPRRVYADVIRHLQQAGARTIAFDVWFATPSPRGAQDDQALIDACRASGRVVPAANFYVPTHTTLNAPEGREGPPPLKYAITDRGIGKHCQSATSVITSFTVDEARTPAVGHVNVFPEWDGVMRRVPPVIKYQKQIYPSLALAAATHFLGLKPRDIVARSDSIEVGGRVIPIDENGETLLNWLGSNRTFPTYSFYELLKGKVPDEIFKGTAVIVGVTASGAFEQHATPLSPAQPAVDLQATALDNILSDRPLRTISWPMQLGLLFGFAMVASVFVANRGTVNGSFRTLLLGLLFWLTAYASFAVLDIYIAAEGPLLAAVLTCTLSIAYQQIQDARQLKQAEERYAVAVRGANDGLWDWDLISNEVYFSPRWKEMLGHQETEISSSPEEWFKRVHPDDIGDVKAKLTLHLEGAVPHFQNEHRMLHKDGSYRWMLSRGLRVGDEKGKPARMAGSQTDVTDRRRAEDQLRYDAFHDGLTNLPNRALLMDRLKHAIDFEKRRREYSFVVLFLDFDEFKVINDSLGHVMGDRLLIAIADRLRSCMRPGDTVARMGGDEFVILLDDIEDLKDPARVANRLHQVLALPFKITAPDGVLHEVFTTTSIGIALSTTGYDRPEDILRDADIAMYRAKSTGRGSHAIFDEAMHARALEALRLETDLRSALQTPRRGEESFHVYYQPIISLQSGCIAGFEALARWHHPERGLVHPGGFIKLAEDTGLIVPIDQWMLTAACRQIQIWEERYGARYRELQAAQGDPDSCPLPLSVSVNLSGKQFSQADMVDQIKCILQQTGVDPRCLKLEITEGVLMESAETAAEMLLQLKQLGLRLSIDDFGTGYSSLSYLHRFPLDTLKVDRSFVSRMGTQGENSEIVHTIIALAHNLKMDVVAEGVETREQLSRLRSTLMCDYGQGYLFAKPLALDDATELLESDPCWLP